MSLHHGDCLDVLPTLDAESIDAIVTDPPYGLEFMGKDWDRLAPTTGRADLRPDAGSTSPEKSSFKEGVGMRMGAPKKNPRCRVCNRLRFDHEPRRCSCAMPDWDTRTAEYARVMQDWHYRWAVEAFRVAKPGAHLLAFGGTRTYHRLASAIEDAGWEIRDTLVWAYASGFPKSLDVSKAIDKAAGAERERVPIGPAVKRMIPGADQNRTGDWTKNNGREYQPGTEEPATDAAREWQGWGTALKPAWEPIVLARKPLRGTVAANVQAYGTGALNIDATRIEPDASSLRVRHNGSGTGDVEQWRTGKRESDTGGSEIGRWPANVILTDPIFDGDTPGVVGGGWQSGGGNPARQLGDGDRVAYGQYVPEGGRVTGLVPVDTDGTYSRFFLIPKADRADREPVLGGQLPVDGERVLNSGSSGRTMRDGVWVETHSEPRRRANSHPTVKPTDLMRHLVRLVTPPGGLVLDPFMGSGTTALACEMEGFRWVGIEREAEYIAIAEARLNGTQRGLGLVG